MEYCCFRALALSIQVTGHLTDKKFRRLTYDMMLAWETPAAASQPLLNVSLFINYVRLFHSKQHHAYKLLNYCLWSLNAPYY